MSRILWKTITGSHMWNMQNENSDYDSFVVRAEPTEHILMNTAKLRSIEWHEDNEDVVSHEIGKVIEMLIQGNVNFYWGVMSPIIALDSIELVELQKIVCKNLSKNIFHSINGLAKHNYNKYVLRTDNLLMNAYMQKKLKTIIRTLRFGTYLFENHKFNFCPVEDFVDINTYKEALKDFQIAYANCSLPEKPDEKPYREFLYKIRLEELK